MKKILNKIKNIFFKNKKENKDENKKIHIYYDNNGCLFFSINNSEEKEKILYIINKFCAVNGYKFNKIQERKFFQNEEYPVAVAVKLKIKNGKK